MKSGLLATALVAAAVVTGTPAIADDVNTDRPLTVAVFGDWPYNQNLLDNAPLLINSINADRGVSLIIHVGDIHSGSISCTSAGILPPIPTSNPGWNQGIYFQFQQFTAPLVYTPGDNEWTDCHKTKQFKSGAPLNELASVRSLFFAQPDTRSAERTRRSGARRSISIPVPRRCAIRRERDVARVEGRLPDAQHAGLEQRHAPLDERVSGHGGAVG